jgi:hypothetical protein
VPCGGLPAHREGTSWLTERRTVPPAAIGCRIPGIDVLHSRTPHTASQLRRNPGSQTGTRAGGLPPLAQQLSELHDQIEQGGADLRH